MRVCTAAASLGGNCDGEMVFFSRDIHVYAQNVYSTFSECANAIEENLLQIV